MKARIKEGVYLMSHQNKTNQRLHYFAFLFAFLAWIFLFINLWVTLFLAILHYFFSWIGHFFFEGNKPASFKHPFLGFYAGFLWFFIRTFATANISKNTLATNQGLTISNEPTLLHFPKRLDVFIWSLEKVNGRNYYDNNY
jgi:hypothetical protein